MMGISEIAPKISKMYFSDHMNSVCNVEPLKMLASSGPQRSGRLNTVSDGASPRIIALSFVLLVLSACASVFGQATNSWVPTTSGSWNTASNWTLNSVPNGLNQQVTIVSNITSTTTISLDVPVTLLKLTIGDGSDTFILNPTNVANTLTFAGNLDDAELNHTTGTTDFINADIINQRRLLLGVSAGTLALNGGFLLGSDTVEKNGNGTVDVRGAFRLLNYSSSLGNVGLIVNAGTMQFSNPASVFANNVLVQGGTLNFGGRAASQLLSVAVTATPTNSLTVSSSVGLSAGMAVYGINIPIGTYIQSVAGNVLTLNNNTLGAIAITDRLVFGGPTYLASANSLAGASTITVDSVSGLVANMTVAGTGIAAGTVIQSIAGNVVTLSKPTTGVVNTDQSVYFGSSAAPTVATFSTVAAAGTGVTALTVNSIAGLAIGMTITGGSGIAGGTTITGLSGTTVTLSTPTVGIVSSGQALAVGSFTGAVNAYAVATSAAGTNTVTVNNTTGLAIGMYVTGPNVPAGTSITAVNAATGVVTLSQNLGGSGTAVAVLNQFYFGTGQTTFVSGKGNLNVTGGTVNIGTTGSAVNYMIDADKISITGGTLNLQNSDGAGVTTVLGGASNLLKLDGGTVNVLANGAAAGTVNFASTINLQLNGAATFNFSDNVGTIQNFTFASLNSSSNSAVLRSAAGSATLSIGGDGVDDVFAGQVNLASSAAASRLIKVGTETLTLSGTADNNTSRLTVNQGTVILAKDSAPAVHAIGSDLVIGDLTGTDTVKIGGTWAGIGNVNMPNLRDQIAIGATITINSNGVLDLNGNSEAVNTLAGTGTVTNSVSGTTSILMIGENNPGTFTWSGRIQDGGATAKTSLWKSGSNSIDFNAAQTYTGETLVGRSNLRLFDTGGALAGTSQVRVSTTALLFLDDTTNRQTSQDRINNTSTLVLELGGAILLRRNPNNANNSTETMGNLTVQNGFSLVRFDHTDGSGTGANIFTPILKMIFSGYTHAQGGVVAFTEFSNNVATGFSLTTGTNGSQVQFTNLGGTWLVGDGDSSTVDPKILIGAYGGTSNNNPVDRMVTLDASGFVRMLDQTSASDFATQIGGATTVSSSNLTIGSATAVNRDDNARIGANYTLRIEPTTPGATSQLFGEQSFNSIYQTTGVVTLSEQNLIRLGGKTADANYNSTSGSGMMLFSGTSVWNGGYLDFGTREAILRMNALATLRTSITGTSGLTTSGGSRLELEGFNTYAGITSITQGETRVFTSGGLGLAGAANGVNVSNANLSVTSGIVVPNKPLTLFINGNLLAFDQTNTWSGDVLINNNFATGANNNATIQVNDNAALIVAGRITGLSSTNPTYTGGINGDPSLNGNGQSRGLIFTNSVANGSSIASSVGRNGIVVVNGTVTDEDFDGAIANHQRLNIFVRGYTGTTSATNSQFNVFLTDASQTNGQLDLRSGYLHLTNGYASAGGPGGAGTSVTVTADAFTGDVALTVNSVSGLSIGTVVTGVGIDIGTTISAIDSANNIITLSAPLVGDMPVSSSVSSGAGGTFTIIRQDDGGNVDRAGTISALLVGNSGAKFLSPSLQIGEQNGTYSSNNIALIGGEHTSGTVQFGAGNNTLDMNPLQSSSGGTVTSASSPALTNNGNGTSTFATTNAANLRPGYGLVGTNIPLGTKITAISGNNITINVVPSSIPASTGYTFGYVNMTSNQVAVTGVANARVIGTFAAANLGDQVIQMNTTDGLVTGMSVTGTGVPTGATISQIDYQAGTVTLNTGLSSGAPVGSNFSFSYNSGSQVLTLNGDLSATAKIGMGITGTGIQADSKIVDVSTYIDGDSTTRTVLTLSKTTNAAATFGTTTYSLYNLSNLLQISDTTGLQLGMGLSGTGIRPGTVITAIDPLTGTITLSAPNNALINSPNAYSFPIMGALSLNTNTAQPVVGTTLSMFSVGGLSIGSTVSGTGIANGTVITAINPITNIITLSAATTSVVGANTALTFQKTSNFSETRLYQNIGGTSDFQLRFSEDSGFGLQNEIGAITKVGRGIAQISGSTQGASDLDGGLNVHGGALILSYGAATTNNSRINGGNTTSPYPLTLAGGELRLVSNGAAGTVTENARGNFTMRPGNSMMIGQGAAFATITFNFGLDNPFTPKIVLPNSFLSEVTNPDWSWREPDRFAGSTIQFYADPTTGGTTRFYYSQNALPGDGVNGGGFLGYSTALPYATFKGGLAGDPNHVDFASFVADQQSNGQVFTLVGDSSGLVGQNLYDINGAGFAADVSQWGNYVNGVSTEYMSDDSLSVHATGYSGTLASGNGSGINTNDFFGAKLIRFTGAVANNTINIGAGIRLALGTTGPTDSFTLPLGAGVADGGAILISDTVGANNTKITGGSITSGLLSNYFSSPLTTGTASANSQPGTSSITLSSTVGVRVGMTVSGTGVVPGTYITAISGNTVTLNTGLNGTVASGAPLEFRALPEYHIASQVASASSSALSGATSIQVSSAYGLVPGMVVSPAGAATSNPFASGTTILSISGTTVNLSKPLTGAVSAFDSLSFDLFGAAAPLSRSADTTQLSYPYQPAPATYTSRDLIIHNYNPSGVFILDSQVVDFTNAPDLGPSKLNLVVDGPGITHLTNATNSYTGTTFVSGGGLDSNDLPVVGTLWVSGESRLGTVPAVVTPASIYLNGGRLKFADDTNPTSTSLGAIPLNSKRGLTLGGNGGYIELTAAGTTLTYGGVIRSEDNIQMGNLASNQFLANIGSGDLIKEGAGRLILTNDAVLSPLIAPLSSTSFTLWNAYYGITDIQAGALQVNISKANSGILGSGDSTIDGTIVRSGARLDLQITGGFNNGTKEWITLQGGILGTTASHVDGSLDGMINVTANSEINVASGKLRLNPNAGFLTGTGTITKTGSGTLVLFDNSSNFTGGWVINNGAVLARSQGVPLGGGGSIVIGDNGAVGSGTTAALYQQSRTTGVNITSQYVVSNNITIRTPSSGSQTKEIGVQNGILDAGSAVVTTGSYVTSSATINLSAGMVSGGVVNISPGMLVTGTGIPVGTVVLTVNATAGTLTISRNTTSAGTNPTFTPFGSVIYGATMAGSPVVYVTNGVSNLSTGMIVSGTGISSGAVITSIDPVANQVFLSANSTATSGVTYQTFTAPSATTAANSATVILPNGVTNLYVGMSVTGTNIPAGATITAVNSNSVTLSANATLAGSIVDFKAFKNFNTVTGSNLVTVTGGVYDLVVGTVLSGITGITNGTTITAVNQATNQITLSANATATTTAVPGAVYNPGQNNDIYHYSGTLALNDNLQLAYRDVTNNPGLVNTTAANTTATLTAGSPSITVASATGLSVGMEVIGTGIPAGARITAIAGAIVTLNVNATTTGSSLFLTAATNIWGAEQGGPIRRVAIDGTLSGTGNLVTVVSLTGAASNLVRTYFELNNADDSAWTGDITTGNAADTQTQQHVLRIGSDNAVGSNNALTMQYNSTLDVAGHSSTIGDLTVNAGVVASGTGASLKGIIVENASNTAAALTINQVSNQNWDVFFQDGITPAVYSAVTTTTHDNTLGIIKAGAGTATMTQNNAYTGSTTLAQGVLSVSTLANGGSLSNIGASTNVASNLIFSGGALLYTGAAVSTDRLFTITPTGGTINASGASNAALTFTNTNAEISSDAPSRSATTALNSNVISGLSNVWDLAVGMTVTIPGTGITNATITAVTPGTGNNNSSITVNQIASTGLTATATFGAFDRALVLTGTSTGANSLAGILSDSSGGGKLALTKSGTGVWVLSETSTNTYSGNTTVSAGTLRLGASNVLPDGAGKGNVLVNSGAVFDLNGKTDTINGLADGISGGGVVDNVTGAGAPILTFGAGNATASFSGTIQNTTGTVAITKTGTGTQTLSGNNTFTGLTSVSAGTLSAASVNALGSIAAGTTVTSGATLNVSNVALAAEPITLNGSGAAGSSGALTGTGTASTAAGGAITLASASTIGAPAASDALTINGVIGESVASALTISGSGTVELKGADTYTGLTTVSSGSTLIASNAAALGGTTNGTTVAPGGTLTINNVALAAEALTLNGTGVSGNGALIGVGTASTSASAAVTLASASTVATPSSADVLTINSAIGQSGGAQNLTTKGPGIVVFASNGNSYTGTTTVSAGTLQVGVAAVGKTGSGAVSVASGATLAGTGTVAGATTISSGGFVSPGDGGGSAANTGVLTFSSGLTMNSGSVAQLTIKGTTAGNFDKIAVTGGTLTLSPTGTENMVQVNFSGFTPVLGNSWDLLDWVTLSSTLNAGTNFRTGGNGGGNLLLPTLTGGLTWDISNFTTSGVVAIAGVPEPGRVTLLVLGFVSLLARRRRKQK